MANKIKINRLKKTDEYINREWGTVLAQRQYLLNSTDWTQMEDNDLTFESRVRWNFWRSQVRSVKRSDGISKEDAEARFKELEQSMPDREFIESKAVRQTKYQLDISSLAQAKVDADFILKTLHNTWVIKLIPENITLINAKYEELMRFIKKTKKNVELHSGDYPLLSLMQKLGDYSNPKLIAEVSNLKRSANEALLMIEEHRVRFQKSIQAAKTTDEVINLVKAMHGY